MKAAKARSSTACSLGNAGRQVATPTITNFMMVVLTAVFADGQASRSAVSTSPLHSAIAYSNSSTGRGLAQWALSLTGAYISITALPKHCHNSSTNNSKLACHKLVKQRLTLAVGQPNNQSDCHASWSPTNTLGKPPMTLSSSKKKSKALHRHQ